MSQSKLFASLLSLTLFAPALLLTSCNSEVDYVHDSNVKLTLDYKDKDFFEDGIGQVDLKYAIDGDTAHFEPLVRNQDDPTVIKSRFYGIDTPESTGQIQPYGKGAAKFTAEKLQEADEHGTIVVSAPITSYSKPSFDSTGTRYLSLIWINTEVENAPFDQLYLLNLWLVQEGWSNVKGVNEMPDYADTFYEAEAQAQRLKKNMFSGEDDPEYNYGGYQDVSLLQIKREIEKSLEDPDYVNPYSGAKLRFKGTVAGFADHILYIQDYYSKEQGANYDEGEWAGINFFTGMSPIDSKFTKPGTYLEVCGTATDSELFGFQMTSGKFLSFSDDEDNAKVLIPASENTEEYALKTFAMSGKELSESKTRYLYSPVTLTDTVTVTGGYDSDDGDSVTLYVEDALGNRLPSIYVTFMYRPDADDYLTIWNSVEDFKGKTFKVSGIYGYHKSQSSSSVSYQIIPRNDADLVLQEV